MVFLFTVGELLEGIAAGRARAGIEALGALVPRTALRIEDGTAREVPAASLKVGDLVLVRPGDRVSADGILVAGMHLHFPAFSRLARRGDAYALYPEAWIHAL